MLRREGSVGAGAVLAVLDLLEMVVDAEVVQLLRVGAGPGPIFAVTITTTSTVMTTAASSEIRGRSVSGLTSPPPGAKPPASGCRGRRFECGGPPDVTYGTRSSMAQAMALISE